MVALPYRASDDGGFDDWNGTPFRDVAAAWVIALLLLVGAIVSFTLDHLVTVSADPVATYGAVLNSAATGDDELTDAGE